MKLQGRNGSLNSSRRESSRIVVNAYDDPNTLMQEGELSSKIMSRRESPSKRDENDYEDTGFTQQTNS